MSLLLGTGSVSGTATTSPVVNYHSVNLFASLHAILVNYTPFTTTILTCTWMRSMKMFLQRTPLSVGLTAQPTIDLKVGIIFMNFS